MMTVGQLRDALKDLPDEAQVVLQNRNELFTRLEDSRVLPLATDRPAVLLLAEGTVIMGADDTYLSARLDEALAPFLGHCP